MSWLGVTTTWGTLLNHRSIRKVENSSSGWFHLGAIGSRVAMKLDMPKVLWYHVESLGMWSRWGKLVHMMVTFLVSVRCLHMDFHSGFPAVHSPKQWLSVLCHTSIYCHLFSHVCVLSSWHLLYSWMQISIISLLTNMRFIVLWRVVKSW